MLDDNFASEALIHSFRAALLEWGQTHIRQFPWRYLDDPYRVLVSEFMLHRTQTRQVLPIYLDFIARWPTLADYSNANTTEVHQLLASLGLTWRITGMIAALSQLWDAYRIVPADYEKLVSIPTIGPYIAGATVCFTTNTPLTLIDSNIVRVVGRVYGLDLSGEARRRRTVIDAIARTVDPENPRDFYYAIIDLAHLLCRPRNPLHDTCPLFPLPCQYSLL